LQPRSAIPQVFLSYSWSDKEIATQLADTLENREIEVWFDEGNMGIGDLPAEKARRAIEQVQYVVVLLSKKSVKSKWVRQEIEITFEVEQKLKELKCFLSFWRTVTYQGNWKTAFTDAFDRLMTFIRLHLWFILAMVYSRLRL
jgi:hypothetical protein